MLMRMMLRMRIGTENRAETRSEAAIQYGTGLDENKMEIETEIESVKLRKNRYMRAGLRLIMRLGSRYETGAKIETEIETYN
jgi:hypothetical protein